LDASTL
jgi:hypothetical protein